MAPKTKILLIDDEDLLREGCKRLLEMAGYDVSSSAFPEEGLRWARSEAFDIAIVDFRMPGMTGIELIEKLRRVAPSIDIVMMTGYASIEMAVEAMKTGAQDYIAKPFEADQMLETVSRLLKKRGHLGPQADHNFTFEHGGQIVRLIGASPGMQELFAMILKVAPSDSTVLIQGESGTGKELVAKAIHSHSKRKNRAFIAMDCGSLVESLFESELFGHVKGSFTGATATKHGAFELAHGGTFFFDEIGNISLSVQAKILRAIQEKQIRRIGATQIIPVDARVIAATNLDLSAAVENGRFREDLYYRLSVIPIHLPPLRERRQDIPILTDFFITKHNQRRPHKPIENLSAEAAAIFNAHDWPGNVRELENVIERATVIEEGHQITVSSLPPNLQHLHNLEEGSGVAKIESLAGLEKKHIHQVLKKVNWNISQSAKALGIDRKTLYDKIKKYGLQPD